MADVPTTLTGLSALLVAVFGAVGPVAAAASHSVTAPASLFAPVGRPTVIAGGSIAGFGDAPIRIVVSVTSGVVGLSASAVDVTVPAGYPDLGATGPQIAIEGEESAVNTALANLSWTPATPGPAEVTLDAGPAGAGYDPEGGHFYQLVTSPTPLSWTAARDAAAAMTFHQLPGSLATVTTDAERALLDVIAPTDAWVGAAALGAPEDVRWLAAPDAAAAISSFVVEYTRPLDVDGPVAGHAVAALNAALPPAAPGITSVSTGTEEAIVAWHAPSTDGGAPVLGYVVAGDPVGWCTVTSAQTSCVLRGLVGGAAHTFRVAAINEAGLGPWSLSSAPATPAVPVVPEVSVAPEAPAAPTYDPVDTVVQPLPNEAPAIDPTDGTTATPPDTAPDDTVAPATGGIAGSPAVPVARPRESTTTSPAPAPAKTVDSATDDAATATVATGSDAAAGLGDAPAPTVPGPTQAAVVADATAAPAGAGAAELVVVFNVGPGARLEDARFTVRGKHLSPGTVVTVTAHSEPIVVGTVEVAADGTVAWVGQLPADLPDGDHRLIAEGVGNDGSKVERTMALAAESGRLVRIGASSLQTVAPAVATTVPTVDPIADIPAAAAPAESSGGGLPTRALMVVVLLAGVAFLWWRAKSRRSAAQSGSAAASSPAGDSAGTAKPARAAASAKSGGTSRSRHLASAGARRRSRRQPARSV
jgi:hypothetical protein